MSTSHKLQSPEKRRPQLRNAPTKLAHGQVCRAFSRLLFDVNEPSQSGWDDIRQVILSTIRKQAEQAIGSKSVGSTPPWPLHRFLHTGLSSYPDSFGDGQ